ncbi:hypothetical protein D9619_013156 [Psilocybe cf. subviscida]|uniref:Polyketide synthase n=1 Tax=Psilocybe cf. subviscida TaxID=2480587 RepID=A0A8H5EYY9_9AGAR|nr:hypothetical protein D9619_013156 [Psilocybe cf. subviscida]
MSCPIILPVFGGQGLATSDPTSNCSTGLSTTPSSGTLLLESCHAALLEEIACLDAEDQNYLHICTQDFNDRNSVLLGSFKTSQCDNPILSGTILLLDQALRFLAYIDSVSNTRTSSKPILDALKCSPNNSMGIIGFSSGILTACVVASSPSVPSFIVNCVEAYRLALWIGIRSKLLHPSSFSSHSSGTIFRSWSLVLIGMNKSDALCAIEVYHKLHGTDTTRISVTAVMGSDLITVSGHPDDLDAFSQTLPQEVTTYSTGINALYHCSARLEGVRNQVLHDIAARNIRFPSWTDLFAPIRSTYTGDLLDANGNCYSGPAPATLAEAAVDMILLHPVNWDVVIEKTLQSVPSPNSDIILLDIGLGSTLTKRLQRSLAQHVRTLKILELREYGHSREAGVKQVPIAIVGMAVHMPGAASVGDLWSLLHDGMNTSREIPQSRFDYTLYTNGEIPGRSMKTRAANFIDSAGVFDHKFFNISPREARSMDPQQRILLHVGYHALEDAGYVPNGSRTFNPDEIGCFIGCATHDHFQNMRDNIDLYYSTGTLAAFLSGRLSYFLGLGGPSIVVDTACSSSLVAIQQACRALMSNDCQAALAGGVNIISSPDMFLGLDKGHFLSPSGQCKSFDAAADGYSRGEGCGVFVLKRLAHAVAENDRILGVIRGVEVNHSGQAHSITHPHGPTQRALFKQLLHHSNVDPNSVNVVEAHGTGTQAGDTNELDSIRAALNGNRTPNNPLYVTSIKANLGHLEAASGSASLAKVLLMFQHRMIPRQVSLETLNPFFAPLDSDNTAIATNNTAWTTVCEGKPRIAMVNNFGAAGSNAALLVEEYVPKTRPELSGDTRSFVFGISAKEKIALEKLRSQLVHWLKTPRRQDVSLADIAYTLTARRQIFPHRIAIAASSKGELIQKLQSAPTSDAPAAKTSVILVFSGQGCQYRGMGSALYESSPTFRHHIDECDGILVSLGFPGIKGFVLDSGARTDGQSPGRDDFQSALFALQYAVLKVWQSWGIKPVAVVGHSLGEYGALVAAEVLSLRDALFIIATRAKLMEERLSPAATGMVAISASAEGVQRMLDSKTGFIDLSISCFNSPTNCVVSGPIEQLSELQRCVGQEEDWKTTQLDFPFGAHSPIMDSLFDDLVCISKTIRKGVPKIPIISTVFGRLVHAGDQEFPPSDYFARQCVQPVRFTQAIESFLSIPTLPNHILWIEVGPHPTITPMLRSFPALANSVYLPSLKKSQDPTVTISQSLASLYLSDYTMDWRRIFTAGGPVRLTEVPSYPLSGPNFWVPFTESLPSQSPIHPTIKFSFIGSWAQVPNNSNGRVAIFETPIQRLREYIHGHLVGDVPLCPASVYLEMIYSSITLATEQYPFEMESDGIDIHDISFCKALTWDLDDDSCTTVLVVTVDIAAYTFSIKSRASTPGEETLHVTGHYKAMPSDPEQGELSSILSPMVSFLDKLLDPALGNTPETFSTRTIYHVIFPRVVRYSAKFHSLQYLAMPSNDTQATATMVVPATGDVEQFSVHPVFLDTLLHVAGFIANLQGALNDAYICKEIQTMTVFRGHILDPPGKCSIYCTLEKCSDNSSFIAESYAYVETSTGPVVVACMSGIRFQRVRLSGLQASLASLSGKAPFGLLEQQLSDQLNNPLNSWPTLRGIIAKNCEMDLDGVDLDQGLDDLGIDSLMRLELAYNISRVYRSFGYRPQEIALCKTTTDILNLISPASDPQTPSTSISHQNIHSPRTPDATVTPQTLSRTLVNYPDSSPPVRKMIANILDMHEDAIPGNVKLSSLGFDSLASIEATHTLQHKYHLHIPKDFLSPDHTVRDVERGVLGLAPSALSYGATHAPFDRMCKAMALRRSISLLQNSNTNLAPLVLIHDGSGLTLSYERLRTLDRRVWTISNPHFSTSTKWPSLTDMARAYGKLISAEIEGHIILGGWSFGGVVADEVATQFPTRSIVVDGIVLIDAPNPSAHVPLSSSVFSRVLDSVEGLDKESKRLCKEQFKMNGELLRTYRPQKRNGGNHPGLVFLRSTEPYMHFEQENVPSWLSERSNLDTISSGWNDLSGGRLLRALDIPGHHFSPFDQTNVGIVSEKIKEACSILDAMK